MSDGIAAAVIGLNAMAFEDAVRAALAATGAVWIRPNRAWADWDQEWHGRAVYVQSPSHQLVVVPASAKGGCDVYAPRAREVMALWVVVSPDDVLAEEAAK